MTMRPFFCFYGGKWRAALHYPAPEHDTIVEPFAGAAGYATRHHTRNVRLYDADPCIAGLWKYLIRVSPAEILDLPDTVDHIDDVHGPQEAKHLIGFWLNKGTAAPSKSPSAWMRAGTHASSFWGPEIRNRIAEQVRHIKHWRAYHKSYANITYAHPATTFIDPPYQQAGKHYKCSSTAIDFAHLAAWCRGRKGQVIVCENAGASWLPFEAFRAIKGTAGARRTGVSKEVVYHTTDAVPPALR